MIRPSDDSDDPPPDYDEVTLRLDVQVITVKESWWKPKRWSRRVWVSLYFLLAVIAVIIVSCFLATRNRTTYPMYSRLDYKLTETYAGEGFFDKFDYFTGYDTAQGFVHYVPGPQAKELNLTYASPRSAVLRVDTSVGPGSTPDASTGRFSARIESKSTYDDGLFIFDISHTPFGCGTRPALWLADRHHWPEHGEIDVMEATNKAIDGNLMSLHTTGGCTMTTKRRQSESSLHEDCNSATNDNAGCGVQARDGSSTGEGFNSAGGGIMALEWRDAGIRMWQFARHAIPRDIVGQRPDPTSWGKPAADFPNTHCDIGSHFMNHSIILNIDLCGRMVYGAWAESGCSGNCTDLVANHPEAFTDAYWEVRSFHVYQAS